MILRNAHEIKIKINKQTKNPQPQAKTPTKNFIRKKNFCRAGNSPIHLSFYSGDIMNNFQLKYLLRSKSKGKKCVSVLNRSISI